MDNFIATRKIDVTLKHRGFTENGTTPLTYTGKIQVHGKDVDIKLIIPDVYFVELPTAHLLDRTQILFQHIAHVETDSGICFASAVGLPLDIHKPGEAILRILKEVEQALESSYAGKGKNEIADEFQAYWGPSFVSNIMLHKDDSSSEIEAFAFPAYKGEEFHSNIVHTSKNINGFNCKKPHNVNFYHVTENLVPSDKIIQPKTLKELEEWLSVQEALKHLKWFNILSKLVKMNHIYIAAPNAVVGFKIEPEHPIFNSTGKNKFRSQKIPQIVSNMAKIVKIKRMAGNLCNLPTLTNRNTPLNNKLSNYKIALIGCGTIGSHLAKMLVQAGAGITHPLEIYDNQILREGNIGRHLLGFDAVGQQKSKALKKELDRYHPEVNVQNVQSDALKCWKRLSDNDLIIDATGDWNFQSALNCLFLETFGNIKTKAILHTWIVMNGAAVQSFLNLCDDFACFRCLKPEFDGPWRYPATKTDKDLIVQPASCGEGAYIPYSVAASAMAASLALCAAIDWSSGNPGSRLRTTVVDFKHGRAQKPATPSPSDKCPACSSIRKRN